MFDKLKKKGASVVAIISPVIWIVSFILDSFDAADRFIKYMRPVMVVSALFTFGAVIWTIYKNKKYIALQNDYSKIKENNILLEQNICQGKKYIQNKATVTFDTDSKKYRLQFDKEYIIISDSIKWYEGQFYSNNTLYDSNKSQEFYDKNPVLWDALKIKASLQYKNDENESFSPSYNLVILKAAAGNNYKQFHIQYSTVDGKLGIQKGSHIRLTYTYEVSIDLWGNYLNRYITYWGEMAEVKLCFPDSESFNKSDIVIQKANNGGEPTLVPSNSYITEKGIDINHHTVTIKLPQKRCVKYMVVWNADSIFNRADLNIKICADRSELTQF